METIRNYLDNMFANLPKTARVQDIKNNILSNMEEKYNELKSRGKSENEAIGIVISEFGNIDELVNELGIQREAEGAARPVVSREEAEAYLKAKRKTGIQVGIGVILCILSPAVLLLLTNLINVGIVTELGVKAASLLGVIALLVFVTIAVAMFIFTGMSFEPYKYMENGVDLPGNITADLKLRYDRFMPTFNLSIIVGVCLLILSPVPIFVTSLINTAMSEVGVVILLVIVAFSVFLFISVGTKKESYEHLLGIVEYTRKPKKEDKVIGAVASFVWPLAVLIFLFCGFAYHLWYICWIVFPITGILFGMFSATYSILTGKNED